jgi:hypothetical protein
VHFDILLERDAPDERRAIAFRVAQLPDFFGGVPFVAERIRDHRAVYLEYEGPVPAPGAASPDTPRGGSVERVAACACKIDADTPDFLDVALTSGSRRARLLARPVPTDPDGARWRFTPR